MKTKIEAAFLTVLVLSTLFVFGFIVYLFPNESIVYLILVSALIFVFGLWKIIYNILKKGGEQ